MNDSRSRRVLLVLEGQNVGRLPALALCSRRIRAERAPCYALHHPRSVWLLYEVGVVCRLELIKLYGRGDVRLERGCRRYGFVVDQPVYPPCVARWVRSTLGKKENQRLYLEVPLGRPREERRRP